MRSLAVKIFLAFWLIHAVIFVVLAFLPDTGGAGRFATEVRRDGRVAASLLEQLGPAGCTTFLDAVEQRAGVRLALLDARQRVVCTAAGGVDPLVEGRLRAGPDVLSETVDGRHLAVAPVEGPSGSTYVVTGVTPARSGGRPGQRPFPTTLLVTAIVVSGVVCLLLARYMAYPLGRMRQATQRLAAGDLEARAGAAMRTRHDEVGDLVRDFDAMADRIATLVRSQTQLLSDISHELRSPLARLNVALELARRKAGDAAAADLRRIEVEAERMNKLIGQVLALARAERDRRVRTDRVDLAAIVRQVADDAEYEARRQGRQVHVRADASAAIDGDPELVARAVENVVRNAVRHTEPGTAVEISTSVDTREAAIVVRDHGPGVPEDQLERIFAPFHRVESARSREAGGVGLGLAIARRAVAVHHGTIVARNAAGGGLEVEIRLPLR